ncbi:MAG: ParB/RepB/Spo0J family partition protein [Chloroflexota bacterium]|nr:ParB/RepB/Spo0J family partition protein [Chloroflexota bacterium]
MPASPRPSSLYDQLRDRAGVQEITPERLAVVAEQSLQAIPSAVLIPVERITENPDNPRQKTSEQALHDLAASIAERGLLQPLVVRRAANRPGHYVVIAGSRRLLAARLVSGDPNDEVRARVAQLPCVVKDVADRDAFADALLENLARADLSRAEMMEAVLRLHRDYEWSGKYIAKRTGRNQGDISTLLKVASSPPLRDLVRNEVIKPTVAGIIAHLPDKEREQAIADAEAGRVRTVADIKRRQQAIDVNTTETTPTAAQHVEDVAISKLVHGDMSHPIAPASPPTNTTNGKTFVPPTSEAVASLDMARGAQDFEGVLISIPQETAKSDVVTAARERMEEIIALVAMINMATPTGKGVLTKVQQHLDDAYTVLASHVRRQE